MRLVADIFANDEDLLDGFYQFLPDKRTQHQAAARLDEILNRSKLEAKVPAKRKGESSTAAGASASLPQKRKRKAPEKEKEPVAKAGPSKVRPFLSYLFVTYL